MFKVKKIKERNSMAFLFQAIFIIGGVFALIGSHIFFKNKPAMEDTVDEIVEQVVKSQTSLDLSVANNTLDNLVDAVEMDVDADPEEENK